MSVLAAIEAALAALGTLVLCLLAALNFGFVAMCWWRSRLKAKAEANIKKYQENWDV